MRYFIIGAACAISIIGSAISIAYGALSRTPAASSVPTAGVAVATLTPIPQPRSAPATPVTTALVAVEPPPPRAPCDIDEGIWKPWSGHAATTQMPDEPPQVLSDTMVLSPPGGTVPMPNACLPQQTPQPTTQPELLHVIEPASP